jgi:Tfp pilus assembly protein PilF
MDLRGVVTRRECSGRRPARIWQYSHVVGAMLGVCVTLSAMVAPATAGGSRNQQTRAIDHLRAGQTALQAERYEEAEREFKQAIEMDPLLELAHYGLGQTYMATKRYVEAVRAYVATRDAFVRASTEEMADSLAAEQRLDDQIRSLRDQKRFLESGKVRGPTLQNNLTKIDEQISQLTAERGRKRGGSAPVTPPYISIALGGAYFRTNAFADAEREWRAALKVNPKLGEAHNNLAVLLMLTGRFDEAEQEVQLAEKSGHKVSDAFKADLMKARKAGKG